MSVFDTKLDRLREQANGVLDQIALHLEDELERAVLVLSRAFPDQMITGTSAFGEWSIDRMSPPDAFGQVDVWQASMPPYLHKAFYDIQQEFGWNAIPAPIMLRALAGVVVEWQREGRDPRTKQ